MSIGAGSSPGGYLPLSLYGFEPIAGVGDDSVTPFSVPSFTYAGQSYNVLQVSSNGNVQVGASGDATFINQNLPDPTEPNNTLAAFWTDLNPGVAGAIRVGTLTDGSDTWIVVDWDSVPEFSVATKTHSFEVWIGIDGDAHPGQDVSYAYGTQDGNGDGGFLTVGAENFDGTTGGHTYYNGTGNLPTNGTQLLVPSTPGLTADFTATPTSGTEPLHVGFDATASTAELGIQSYAWDFGDGGSDTGISTSHDYAAGSFTATLTITDTNGNTCSASGAVEVDVAPSDTTDPVVTCDVPGPVFAVGQSPASVTGSWVDETDPVTAQPVSAAADTSSAGAKTVTLSGTDAAGNIGSASCAYSVTDAFLGFQAPLPKSTKKAGSTIPVKFTLGVYGGGSTRVTTANTKVTFDGKTANCAYSATIAAYQCQLKMPTTKGTYTIEVWENLGSSATPNWVVIANAATAGTKGNGEAITVK